MTVAGVLDFQQKNIFQSHMGIQWNSIDFVSAVFILKNAAKLFCDLWKIKSRNFQQKPFSQ